MTYLTRGRVFTPPNIRPTANGYTSGGFDESGRYLVEKILEGTLEILRDPRRDDSQVSLHNCEVHAIDNLSSLVCLIYIIPMVTISPSHGTLSTV